MPTKQTTYKYCIVNLCPNTTINAPNKIFVQVPMGPSAARNKWLKLARRNPKTLSNRSTLYICEDHFDLPNDMENYMQYKMKATSRICMRRGCLPNRFNRSDSSDMLNDPAPKPNENQTNKDNNANVLKYHLRSRARDRRKPKKKLQDNQEITNDDTNIQDGNICTNKLYDNLRTSKTPDLKQNVDDTDDTQNGSICLSELYETLREQENLSILQEQKNDGEDIVAMQSKNDQEILDENRNISPNTFEIILDELDAILNEENKYSNQNNTGTQKNDISENDQSQISTPIGNEDMIENLCENKNANKSDTFKDSKNITSQNVKLYENLNHTIMTPKNENTDEMNIIVNHLNLTQIQNETPELFVMENRGDDQNDITSLQSEKKRNDKDVLVQNRNVEHESFNTEVIRNNDKNINTIETKSETESENSQDCRSICPSELFENLWENQSEYRNHSIIQHGKGSRNLTIIQNENTNGNGKVIVIKSEKQISNSSQSNNIHYVTSVDNENYSQDGSISLNEMHENLQENETYTYHSLFQNWKENEMLNKNHKIIQIENFPEDSSISICSNNQKFQHISEKENCSVIYENQDQKISLNLNEKKMENLEDSQDGSICSSELYENLQENQNININNKGNQKILVIELESDNENIIENDTQNGRICPSEWFENTMENRNENPHENLIHNDNCGKKIIPIETKNNEQHLMENVNENNSQDGSICPNELYKNLLAINTTNLSQNENNNGTQDGSIYFSELYENLQESAENSNQFDSEHKANRNVNANENEIPEIYIIETDDENPNVLNNSVDNSDNSIQDGSICPSELYENLRDQETTARKRNQKIQTGNTNQNLLVDENDTSDGSICPSELYENLVGNRSSYETDNDTQDDRSVSICPSELYENLRESDHLNDTNECGDDNITQDGSVCRSELYENLREIYNENRLSENVNYDLDTQDGSICLSELYENLEENENLSILHDENENVQKNTDILAECVKGLFSDDDSWLSFNSKSLQQQSMLYQQKISIDNNQVYYVTDPNHPSKKPRRKIVRPRKSRAPGQNNNPGSKPKRKRVAKPRILITIDGQPLKRRRKIVTKENNNNEKVKLLRKKTERPRKALIMVSGEPRKRRYKKRRKTEKKKVESGSEIPHKRTRRPRKTPSSENRQPKKPRTKQPKRKRTKRILFITGKIDEVTDSAESDYSCFSCVECGYKTGLQRRINRHIEWHAKKRKQSEAKCTKCSKRFAAFRCLRRHIHALHRRQECILRCDKCPYYTENQFYMKKHKENHEKEAKLGTVFICYYCSFITKYKFNLKMHIKTHRITKPVEIYECNMCDYRTKRIFSLNRHFKTKKHLTALGLPVEEFYVREPPRKRRLPLPHSPSSQTRT